MYPAETVVIPGSRDGASGLDGSVVGTRDGGATVVTGHVAGGGVFVRVLVPGALNQVFLAFEWVGPFVA
jgi:hypothetical protein